MQLSRASCHAYTFTKYRFKKLSVETIEKHGKIHTG
jgi:hypothetical protein